MKARVRPQPIVTSEGVCRVALFTGKATEEQVTACIRARRWDLLMALDVRWYSPWRRRWMSGWSDALMRGCADQNDAGQKRTKKFQKEAKPQ